MARETIPVELVGAIYWSPQYGELLKQIRERKGLSRLQLHDKVKQYGLSTSTQNIQRIEDGGEKKSEGLKEVETVPVKTLEPMLKALDYSLVEFLSEVAKLS